MTVGKKPTFSDINTRESQRQAQLQEQLRRQAEAARRMAEPEVQRQSQSQLSNLDNDEVVTSEAIRDHARESGWQTNKVGEVLSRYNEDGDGLHNEQEFDAIMSEFEAEGVIPAAGADATVEAPGTHTVESGDYLSKIAAKYTGDSSRWRELYDLNKDVIGSNPNLIKPGQELKLPDSWKPAAPEPAGEAEAPEATEPAGEVQDPEAPEATDPTEPLPGGNIELAKAKEAFTKLNIYAPPTNLPAEDQQAIRQGQEAAIAEAETALGVIKEHDPESVPTYQAQLDEAKAKFEDIHGAPPSAPAPGAEEASETGGAGKTGGTGETEAPAETEAPEAEAPAPGDDAQAGQALVAQAANDPFAAARWSPRQQQQVQAYAEHQVAAATSAYERGDLAGVEQAKAELDGVINATHQAPGLQNAVVEVAAEADLDAKIRDLKIKAGDDGAVKDALKAADKDSPEDYQRIAEMLPESDPRRGVLTLMADANVSPKVRDQLRKALQDNTNTGGDLHGALGGVSSAADAKAVAAAMRAKAPERYEAQAKAMDALASDKVGGDVREEVANALRNGHSLHGAMSKAKSPEDFVALKAAIDANPVAMAGSHGMQQNFEAMLRSQLRGSSPERRAELAAGAKAAGSEELSNQIKAIDQATNPEVQKRLQHAMQDDTSTYNDMVKALENAESPEDFAAIAAVAGRSDDLKDFQAAEAYGKASPGVREQLVQVFRDDWGWDNEEKNFNAALAAAETSGDFAAIAAAARTNPAEWGTFAVQAETRANQLKSAAPAPTEEKPDAVPAE